MGTRKNEYLQNLCECWQNDDKFITTIQCKETLYTLMLWFLNHLVKLICIYVLYVSYYFSQIDIMAIFLSFLHQLIIFQQVWWSYTVFFNKFGEVIQY